MIDEQKYFDLFDLKFKSDSEKLKTNFHRIVINGKDSEATRIQFFKNEFQWVIARIKKDFLKDENYEYIVSASYNIFINRLREDGIDSNSEQLELATFLQEQNNKLVGSKADTFVPDSKNYNLNTKYGRRKARDQALRNYENGSQEYRDEIDKIKIAFWIVVIVIAIIVFAIKTALK
jgi:hypothetical protein